MRTPAILIAPGTQLHGSEFSDYSVSLSDAYPQAIMAAGGLPWILPCSLTKELLAQAVERSDGVLLTGGDDIEPKLYRQRLNPRLKKTVIDVDPIRDLAELALIREVFQQRKPLLAICRGHQMLNVAFGGELIVDIPSEVEGCLNHAQMDQKDRAVHEIQCAADSILAGALGKRQFSVNSTHHQAVRKPAAPFRVVAQSADGVVEAMELGLADRHLLPYLLAVQFHPERLVRQVPEFLELFRSFIQACASGRKR